MQPESGGDPQASREQLQSGIAALGLPVDASQVDALLHYQALLERWGRVYNLTALREPSQVLVQHLLDSVSLVAPLRRHMTLRPDDVGAGTEGSALRLLDVGSGAGLPGVVVAVLCPDWQVTCVDAVSKKASFIRQAAAELALKNLSALHGRVEVLAAEPFDVVVSRAFASLADFVALTRDRLAANGVWVAMKGRRPDDELAELPQGIDVFHVEPLRVPGLDAERCLVWMRRR